MWIFYGNAKHVGIYLGDPHGSIHSTTGGVQYSKFPAKRWTHVGLLSMIDYTGRNHNNITKEDIFSLIDKLKGMIDQL